MTENDHIRTAADVHARTSELVEEFLDALKEIGKSADDLCTEAENEHYDLSTADSDADEENPVWVTSQDKYSAREDMAAMVEQLVKEVDGQTVSRWSLVEYTFQKRHTKLKAADPVPEPGDEKAYCVVYEVEKYHPRNKKHSVSVEVKANTSNDALFLARQKIEDQRRKQSHQELLSAKKVSLKSIEVVDATE